MLEFLHSLDQSAQDRLSWQFLLSAVKTIESQHCRVFWQVDEHTLEISCEHSESTRDVLGYSNDDGWSYSDNLPPIFKAVFDLYLPVITKPANSAVFVVGHLGQSIDSQIATRWTVPGTDGDMPVASIVALLESRGLTRLFVEGGGITVGRFFEAGLLHRLHIAIAPLLVGAGTPSLQLPGSPTMLDAHRPNGSLYSMGDDVMWDFDLTKSVTDGPTSATDGNGALQRIY